MFPDAFRKQPGKGFQDRDIFSLQGKHSNLLVEFCYSLPCFLLLFKWIKSSLGNLSAPSSVLTFRFVLLQPLLPAAFPSSSPLPSTGHAAFTALSVLFGGPTPHPASLPTSLFAYRVAYSVATQKPGEVSRGHACLFRTVLSAHTLVRRENENAFASIVQARPVPVFGRPVHPGSRLRLRPGTSPHALRISPRGEHPALRWYFPTGQRDITPAFGYGAPHLSTRGTSTLLIHALPGAHYGLG
jgi:hypothetical protein